MNIYVRCPWDSKSYSVKNCFVLSIYQKKWANVLNEREKEMIIYHLLRGSLEKMFKVKYFDKKHWCKCCTWIDEETNSDESESEEIFLINEMLMELKENIEEDRVNEN